ncbi:AraC family transcriptional regulator [Flagellimonas onchidii]|uniref:AraC family transcriptional regulator n=1 Tax=Flagellimonas onchidii TaxID=2562684 RepID=UPI0010A5F1A7|nr:AraC family transcriptional regulator [Allomuricauda onchidii]
MQKQTNKRKVFQLNTLGFNRCLDFGHYRYNSVESLLDDHQHTDVLEICFCLKGQQYYQIGEDLIKLTGNHMLIVPPNVNHSSGVYPEDIGELYWIQISLDSRNGHLFNLPNNQSDFLLTKLVTNGGNLIKGAFGVKHLLEKLMVLLEHSEAVFNRLQIGQAVIQLLIEVSLLTDTQQPLEDSERVIIIKDFIGKNLHRIIYVDELAALLDFSIPYLKSWFKLNFGVPPRAYINRLKIEQAKAQLSQKKTITEVAFELGFGSSQYFATTFKKYTGMSPKTYKAMQNQS